jgi:hypothetical protein
MKQDPIIADVRKKRDEISERFNGDMDKIYAFFKQEELKSGARVKNLQRRKKSKTSSR